MPLALVLPTAHSPAMMDLPEYAHLVDELHAARAMCASGPQVLMLVNELVLLCEEILEFSENADALSPGSACCAAAERFLAELVRHTERIRAGNGQLDEAFFDLIETLPETVQQRAA